MKANPPSLTAQTVSRSWITFTNGISGTGLSESLPATARLSARWMITISTRVMSGAGVESLI